MSARKNGSKKRPIPGSRQFAPTEAIRKELHHLLEELPTKPAASVPLLLSIQEEFGLVGPAAQEWVADVLELPLVKIREVVTFYTMLKEHPVGRQHIRVCRNISCALVGAEMLIGHMERRIGCKPGHRTTNGELSWETVECLGACELAPVLQWDEEYIGPVDSNRFDDLHRAHGAPGDGN